MSKSKLFASVAVAALMAMPAFAQTTSPSTAPSASRPATTSPSGAPAARPSLPSDIGSMKVSELVGKNVYTANDEKIGDVNDVVTSKSGGEGMAVIGVGGFLGIGEKEAAVPLDQLKVQGDKIVVAGATKDSLKQHAADYKKDEYTKVDRNMMVSQAGVKSSAPSGSSSTGSSGSSTMGGTTTSPAPSGAPSASPSTGMSGSGSSSSGSSSGSTDSGSSSSTGGSTMGGSSSGSSPAGNAPSSGGSSTQTPKQ